MCRLDNIRTEIGQLLEIVDLIFLLENTRLMLFRLRTIIAALHCNILIRKDDLVRNLDYVASVLESVQQDETR